MSYSLIYDKQFVKLTDKLFIPMILAGDSNCYDHSGRNARRSRSWSNFSYLLEGAIAGTLEQMLERMNDERQRQIDYYKGTDTEYKDSSFGGWSGLRIGGSIATFGTYTGLAKTGCKKALTIEQLAEEGVHINVHTMGWNDTKEKIKEAGLEPVSFVPKSTQDMLDFIENVAPKYKGTATLYIEFGGMYESKPKYLRAKYFPKPASKIEKVEVLSRYGYAIKIFKEGSPYGYLYSYRGGTFRYSGNETGGKQFLDKKEAERWAKKIDKRRYQYTFEVIVVDYGQERRFYVPEDKAKNLTLPEPEPEVEMTDEELISSLMLKPEGEEVHNMFDPEQKCFLDPVGVALHDLIKGCEALGRYSKMEQALGIFREKYPEEYMTLLD